MGIKKGIKGYSGSCNEGRDIWGVSANGPTPERSEHGDAVSNDPGPTPGGTRFITDAAGRNGITSRGFAYNARDWTNIYGLSVRKDIIPDLWPRPSIGGPSKTWYAFAAKIASSYPYGCCDKYPPVSSAVDGGDGTWQGCLGSILEVGEWSLPGDIAQPKVLGLPKGFGYVLRSRACYLNGKQCHVIYSTLGNFPPSTPDDDANGNPYAGQFMLPNTPRPTAHIHGDTYIFNIANPQNYGRSSEPDTIEPLYTATLNGFINMPGALVTTGATAMEGHFHSLDSAIDNVLDVNDSSRLDNKQYPANAIYLGPKYAGFSSYHPEKRSGGSLPYWQFGRILFDDQRPPFPAGPLEPGMFVFATFGGGVGPSPDLGDPANDDYSGDYIVALFSIRSYRDESVVSEENPDEPHAISIHKAAFYASDNPARKTKILATNGLPFISKVYRPGFGDADTMSDGYGDGSAIADGTLSPGEVAAGEMLMDSDSPPEGYEDEVFTRPKIWAYSREWDPVEKKNVNLAIITTEPDSNDAVQSGVIATFEAGNINTGMPEGFAFDNYGTGFEENSWISSTAGNADPETTAYTGDGGTYSALSDLSLSNEGTAELSRVVHVTTAATMTFKYRVANRTNTVPGTFEFSNLVNIPTTEVYMNLFVDGILIQKFDMINYPVDASGDGEAFNTWYDYELPLDAGTHTIRWSAVRTNLGAYAEANIQLDHITFPDFMIGDDINGLRRWYWDGYVLRKLSDWTWAVRDDESHADLSARAKTVPHSITFDGAGRILIGNPQYTMRRLRDGSLDRTHGRSSPAGAALHGGIQRWSASPNIERPLPPCVDPDTARDVDEATDAPWGSHHLISVGLDAYQVIGANADLDRDMTHDPVDKELWKYKHPVTGKINHEIFRTGARATGAEANWADRVHRWTVSNNGKDLSPHYEMVWRPGMHQPSWPGEGGTTDAERFPHPPYRSDFASSNIHTDYAPISVRWRDPLQLFVSSSVITTTTMYLTPDDHDFNSVNHTSFILHLDDAINIDSFYVGYYARIDGKVYEVTSYTTSDGFRLIAVQEPDEGPNLVDGKQIELLLYDPVAPRWTMINYRIPRTYSDALSRLPQPVWVRATSDGPSNPEGPSYWDPDTAPEIIAASEADPKPWGGPFGSAVWVLVQSRFMVTGSSIMFYVYNTAEDHACVNHGPDDDDQGANPTRLPSAIQRPILPLSAMTDFDAIPCDCGCC